MTATAYIICATPRSGSTLLCDLLADTGVAGRPNSFYRQLSIHYWIETWGVTAPLDSPGFDRVFLEAALQAGQAGTGLFGMRLMWSGVTDLATSLDGLFPDLPHDAARFDAAFGAPAYFHLSRQDKVAQAVSRYRAEQGGLWHRHADGSDRERVKSEAMTYDAAGIAAYLAEAKADNQAWENWFNRQHITPHQLTYEALAEAPRAILADVLASLGLDPEVAKQAAPRTQKLADAESAEWVTRFTREMT